MKSFHLAHRSEPFAIESSLGSMRFKVSTERKLLPQRAAPNEMIFGLVAEGGLSLKLDHGRADLHLGSGMYFSVDQSYEILGEGYFLIIRAQGYVGLNSVGGPLEEIGRLRYIDTCTDSLLIPPTMLGDPCLNLLVFPPGVKQTRHTHPSFRSGLVVAGSGECVLKGDRFDLREGDAFFIDKNVDHCFHSHPQEGLRVLAFHPDSDFGPTHEKHPMINRTILVKPG